jgi:hypothetical protein
MDKFYCNICDEICNDPISLLDHTIIVHDNKFNDNYDDNDNDNYDDNNNYDDNDNYDDKNLIINTKIHVIQSKKMRYKINKMAYYRKNNKIKNVPPFYKINEIIFCPLCPDKIFMDDYMLGEHVSLYHSSYTDQIELSQRQEEIQQINNPSFPGFQVLQIINMINPLTLDNYKTTINDECPVCFQYFSINLFNNKNKLISYEDLDGFNIYDNIHDIYDKYNIDDNYNEFFHTDEEIDYITENCVNICNNCGIEHDEINIDKFKNDVIQIEQIDSCEISDTDDETELKVETNYIISHDDVLYSTSLIYPINLKCCNKQICHKCLKNILICSRNTSCPFCMNEHIYEGDYIKIIVPEKMNKNSWKKWWQKNGKYDMFAGL